MGQRWQIDMVAHSIFKGEVMSRLLTFFVLGLVIVGGIWYALGMPGLGSGPDNTVASDMEELMDDTGDMAADVMDTAEDMVQDVAEAMTGDEAAATEMVELIDRDVFFGNPVRAQARLSPDGTQMSFLAPLDGVMNIWVAPAGDFDAARAISNDQSRGIRQHFWMGNGDYIVYLQDTGGDENWHVHAVNASTGEDRDLTPVPSGSRATIFAGSVRHPDMLVIGTNEREPSLFDPFMLNVVTGEMTLMEENPGFVGYDFDEDLNIRLATQQTATGGFAVLKRDGDEWVPFFEVPQEDSLTTSTYFFNEDGSGIYVISSVDRNTAALYLVDIETGEQTLVAEDPRADISGVYSHPVTNEVLAVSSEYERTEWQILSDDVRGDWENLTNAMDGDVQIVSTTHDFNQWMVAETPADGPVSYYLYDRTTGDVSFLFSTRPELADAPLVPMHPVVIEARDGLDLVSYISLPAGSDADGDGIPEEAQPMVLYVHGGPWARDSYGYSSIHQWLANRGYAVMSVNYRGSSGFGKDFIEAATHEFAGAMHDDLIDAVNWAVEQGITTEDQVAIMGGSYGGYATLVGLTFTPETFACGVDIVGPSNLVTLIESFPAYWAPFMEATWYSRVGDPRTEEGREMLLAASPLTRADDIVRPLLIGQGGNDPRVTKLESDQLTEAMQTNGQQVTYVNYPDEGHGFARPENRDSFFAISEAFLTTCLGGRAQEFGDFAGSSTEVLAGAEHVPGLSEALEGFEPDVRH